MPKRLGHILEKVADFNNIELADINARKGKHNPGIIKHDQNREVENIKLSLDLMNGNFHTSAYKNKIIHEPKERLLYILPYFPDRVVHHAIMQVMETNSKNLAYTIEKVTGKVYNVWYGRYIRVSRLFDINAIIYIKSITERSKYYKVNFIMDNHAYFTRTNNKKLIKLIYQYLENEKSQRNKIRK